MNLTIQQVAKITKLSVPTIYSYTSKLGLGRKVGRTKIFTQADVQKLLKGKPRAKKTDKPRPRKAAANRETVQTEPTPTIGTKLKTAEPKSGTLSVKPPKASFWTRLFGSPKQKQKVSLMEAKIR